MRQKARRDELSFAVLGHFLVPVMTCFIDWIDIQQTHPEGGLPVLNSGRVVSISAEGEREWCTDKSLDVEGSFDSRIRLRCDGFNVRLCGNLSRYGRRDNVVGFTFERCIELANEILAGFDLPLFAPGKRAFAQTADPVQKVVWTGATVSRLDLTSNYSCGENLGVVINSLLGRANGRMKSGTFDNRLTVDFGRGSKWVYQKFYVKFFDLVRNLNIAPEVLEWVKSEGVLRHELTLKSRFLSQQHLRYLGDITMERLDAVHDERVAVLFDAECTISDWSQIPDPFYGTIQRWLEGSDLSVLMSRAKFYRHRKALLEYGVDIAIPCRDVRPPVSVKVVEITPLVVPEWYWVKSAA